jgi:hypothetical protein
LPIDLDGKGDKKHALRWTTMIASAETQKLFLVDAVPTTLAEMRRVLSQHAAFSSYGNYYMRQLQGVHGERWQDWYVGGQVLVSAFGEGQPLFFASATVHDKSSSHSMLVFSIDREGHRKDVCVLRRICDCADICSRPLYDERERAELIPSPKYCPGSGKARDTN